MSLSFGVEGDAEKRCEFEINGTDSKGNRTSLITQLYVGEAALNQRKSLPDTILTEDNARSDDAITKVV
ncbi:hypothetical protein ACS89_06405 [Vibrio parahaemolyticus]|nr:hypothetical protein ACS90_14550 [Vibrio parahaemolyticus]KOE17601.1 hypothetical protein ACS89_06405 [Vibrio parahaemolyticus]KOF21623.1 hypothetical protein ACX16_08565 [Vibrio parahaemolyticus]